MSDRYVVTMWGLTKEQRDVLLRISQEWDSHYSERSSETGR